MIKHFLFYSLRIFIVAGIGGSLWLMGLILFTRLIPSSPHDTENLTDGIVIFTGEPTRLKVALTLFEQKKGHYLLISGVNPRSTFFERVDVNPSRSNITLGYKARDTFGNARETAAWAQHYNIRTLRLITSNYHMPRSLFELHYMLPNVKIFPHPVVGKNFLKSKWWLDSFTLCLVIQEYNKFLFALIRRPFKDLQGSLKIQRNA